MQDEVTKVARALVEDGNEDLAATLIEFLEMCERLAPDDAQRIRHELEIEEEQ